jgi:hypothetical protein
MHRPSTKQSAFSGQSFDSPRPKDINLRVSINRPDILNSDLEAVKYEDQGHRKVADYGDKDKQGSKLRLGMQTKLVEMGKSFTEGMQPTQKLWKVKTIKELTPLPIIKMPGCSPTIGKEQNATAKQSPLLSGSPLKIVQKMSESVDDYKTLP